jgi:predicted RNA-binding Zn-ribbon protein involved in translation (DUF1610 family)
VRKAALKKLDDQNTLSFFRPNSLPACTKAIDELRAIGKYGLIEIILKESFDLLKEKAPIASLLGDHSFEYQADLMSAIHWWVKAITLDDKKELWSPFTFLSSVYSQFDELKEKASLLNDAATDIRGNPVSTSGWWQIKLHDYLSHSEFKQIQIKLRELWDSSLKDYVKRATKQPVIQPGSVHRPDLACSKCGNANVKLGYYGSHWRCPKCGTIICDLCYKRLSWTCPKCHAHEEANYLE